MGDHAFADCTGLSSVVIGDGLDSIVSHAFAGCTSLTSLTISKSVTSIKEGAFSLCTSLIAIHFDGTKEEWTNISKEYTWDYEVPATEVICSDGSASLS